MKKEVVFLLLNEYPDGEAAFLKKIPFMEIQKLDKEHQDSFTTIHEITLYSLTNSSWFIPFTEQEIESAFADTGEVVLYGALEGGTLGAVSALFFDISDLSSEPELSQIKPEEVAEIGGSMTLPEFRGKGYMLAINQELVQWARQKGLKYLLATAHPDNVASNRSLLKLGMRKIKEFQRNGKYLRSLYLMEL